MTPIVQGTHSVSADAVNPPSKPEDVHTRDGLRTTIAVACGILIILRQVNVRAGLTNSLDDSWQQVLAWAITHGAQWGKDLVYTYGPLGFMLPGFPFYPATYWTTLVLQYVLAFGTAGLVVYTLRRLPLVAGIGFLLAAIVLGWNWSTSSPLILFYPLALLALEFATREARGATWQGHLIVATLASYTVLLPLIKFSVFPLWLAWIPLALLVVWRSQSRSLAATFLAGSVATILIAWLACGQQIAYLPTFVAGSWHVAAHYASAMQMEPTERVTDWVALGATLFGLVSIALLAWQGRRSIRRLATCTMFALAFVVALKAGATRTEGGHLMILWSVLAWCAPLLVGLLLEQSGLRGARHATMALVLASLFLALPFISRAYPEYTLQQLYSGRDTIEGIRLRVDQILNPRKTYRQYTDRWSSDRAAMKLPKIARSVRKDSVDLLMDSQNALLANDLAYRPRPAFQSSLVISGGLAQLNDTFFRSTSAPEWVMLDWTTLDNRYPTSNDALALIRILQDYRVVLSERDYLLFRHQTRTRQPLTGGPAVHVEVGFRGATPIPSPQTDAWFAQIDVHLTTYGRLRSLLFREPKLLIDITLRNGNHQRYRLVRAIAAAGFMLSPAIANNGQYLDWLQGVNARDVVAVQLVQQRFLNHNVFRVQGPMRLSPVQLPRKQAKALALYTIFYPGFNVLPESTTGEPRSYTVDGQPVAFLFSPATMTFRLPPGSYDVSARFGLMPNALTDAGCLRAHPDGIGFTIGITAEPGYPQFAKYLDPFADPQHRYAETISHRLEVGAGQAVEVSLTTGPPGSNGDCDWSWIRDLAFEPVASPP